MHVAKVYAPCSKLVNQTKPMEGLGEAYSENYDIRPMRRERLLDWLTKVLYRLEQWDMARPGQSDPPSFLLLWERVGAPVEIEIMVPKEFAVADWRGMVSTARCRTNAVRSCIAGVQWGGCC